MDSYYFEYDAANKVLAVRILELSDRILRQFFADAPGFIAGRDIKLGLFDLSNVVQFELTPEGARSAGRLAPLLPDAIPVVVAPSNVAFGMGRLFQASAKGREAMIIVRTLADAYRQTGFAEGTFIRVGADRQL